MSSEEMDATSVKIPSRRRMTSCLVCFEQNQVSDAVLSMHPQLHMCVHAHYWTHPCIAAGLYSACASMCLVSSRLTTLCPALAEWLIERRPESQRVAGSIPSQGTGLGCGPGPQCGAHKRQPHIDVSLPLFLPLFPSL